MTTTTTEKGRNVTTTTTDKALPPQLSSEEQAIIDCTQKELLNAIKVLGGGLGDPFRGPYNTKKTQIAFAASRYGAHAVNREIERSRAEWVTVAGDPSASQANKTTQNGVVAAFGTLPVAPELSPEEQAIIGALRACKRPLDEERVREIAREVTTEDFLPVIASIIDEAAKRTTPRDVRIVVNDIPREVIKGAHKQFERFAKMALTGLNICITGPSGCGKSMMARHLAESLGRKFFEVSCGAGMSPSTFGARLLPGEGGSFKAVDSAFLKAYTDGDAVIFLDEFDACDPDTTLILNAATSSNGFYCETRQVGHPEGHARTWVPKGSNVIMIAAMNTFGTGANMQYQGRQALDGATLDRWTFLPVEYDEAIDRTMCVNESEREAMEWVIATRKTIAKKSMLRIMSHRATDRAIRLLRAGFAWNDVRETLLIGWSADERKEISA